MRSLACKSPCTARWQFKAPRRGGGAPAVAARGRLGGGQHRSIAAAAAGQPEAAGGSSLDPYIVWEKMHTIEGASPACGVTRLSGCSPAVAAAAACWRPAPFGFGLDLTCNPKTFTLSNDPSALQRRGTAGSMPRFVTDAQRVLAVAGDKQSMIRVGSGAGAPRHTHAKSGRGRRRLTAVCSPLLPPLLGTRQDEEAALEGALLEAGARSVQLEQARGAGGGEAAGRGPLPNLRPFW